MFLIDIRNRCFQFLDGFFPFERLIPKDSSCNSSPREHSCSGKLCLLGASVPLYPRRHFNNLSLIPFSSGYYVISKLSADDKRQ